MRGREKKISNKCINIWMDICVRNDQDFQIDFIYKITKCNTHTPTQNKTK